jgi:uncharacterized protein (TIGR02284 family)
MAERTEHWVLNHLIETCRDGERGFRFAAGHVTSPPVRELFAEAAAQRQRFAADLLPHAQRLGGDAPAEGTVPGALHRGWMTVMGALTQHDEKSILAEADRGDTAAANAYRDALEGFVHPTVRPLIEAQYGELIKMRDRIHELAKT